MTDRDTSTEVRSQERGPHWVAWVPDENGKPSGSVILVGQTREEAERRARAWAAMTVTPQKAV
jgi:predicted RNase H-like HicB family nuclease